MDVNTFLPSYCLSASVASSASFAVPWIFTVEPSLFVFSPPILASNFKPLSTVPFTVSRSDFFATPVITAFVFATAVPSPLT